MDKYGTNLASEFYVMSALYRVGADASLSLGNKKSVDITVVHGPAKALTIDVKGVAGKWDWPADGIPKEPIEGHFIVFVSFEGKIEQPNEVPSVWVVPHTDVGEFRVSYKSRSNISRAKLVKSGERYRNQWNLLFPSK